MSEQGQRRRVWARIDQVLLRSLVPLGVLVSLSAAQAAGGRPPVGVQLGVVALSLVAALRPDSSLATMTLLGSTYVWAVTPETSSLR